MRERYTRELKRYKSTDSGNKQGCPPDAATANVSWSLFDEMSFLYDHVKLRKTRYTFEKSIKTEASGEADPIMCEDQHIDQNTCEATTAGQVYAKFKVQSVDGSDGESRILVNEDYKDYAQLHSVERKIFPIASDTKFHDSYVIINHCADITSGPGDEHEVVVAEEGEEEEEEEEQQQEDEEVEEFLTEETHHQQHHVASAGPRIILTAPRDNTPSPQALPPPPMMHHHVMGNTVTTAVPMHIQKSLKRKHSSTMSNPTTTMTIDPADHSEIVSVHHHNGATLVATGQATGVPHIHHVASMQQQQQQPATLIGTPVSQDDNDFFGSAVSGSLKQLSRLYNIKAKVEIYKVLEKFIEMEDHK